MRTLGRRHSVPTWTLLVAGVVAAGIGAAAAALALGGGPGPRASSPLAVPNLIGDPLPAAETLLRADGLVFRAHPLPPGVAVRPQPYFVAAELPAPGDMVRPGSIVVLTFRTRRVNLSEQASPLVVEAAAHLPASACPAFPEAAAEHLHVLGTYLVTRAQIRSDFRGSVVRGPATRYRWTMCLVHGPDAVVSYGGSPARVHWALYLYGRGGSLWMTTGTLARIGVRVP